jgi:hypothetical protein
MIPDPRMGTMNIAVQRQDERDRMFRDCLGRIGRNTGDLDTEIMRRNEIDMIEPRRSQRDDSNAMMFQCLQHGTVQRVVHEGADRLCISSERGGLKAQSRFKKQEFMPVSAISISRDEEIGVIRFRTENRDFHACPPPARFTASTSLPRHAGNLCAIDAATARIEASLGRTDPDGCVERSRPRSIHRWSG